MEKTASLQLVIKFPIDEEMITKIKKLSGRRWNKQYNHWTAPLTMENVKKLMEAGIKLDLDVLLWWNSKLLIEKEDK
jgi:hypothetical protein